MRGNGGQGGLQGGAELARAPLHTSWWAWATFSSQERCDSRGEEEEEAGAQRCTRSRLQLPHTEAQSGGPSREEQGI